MDEVIVYTKDYCGYCAQAKALLQAKGVTFTEIDVTHDPASVQPGSSFLSTSGPIGAVRVMPLRRSLRSSPPTMANA